MIVLTSPFDHETPRLPCEASRDCRKASRAALIFSARSGAPDYFQKPETKAAVTVTL